MWECDGRVGTTPFPVPVSIAGMSTDLCDRCESPAARLIPAYWGERLCPDCCQLVASGNDMGGSWPPLPDADAAG